MADQYSGFEKIASVREFGKKAYEEGSVKLFTSFPESLTNRFNVSLLGMFRSTPLLWQIHRITTRFGVETIMADLDFPLHSTVLEAVWEGPAEERESVFSKTKQAVEVLIADYAYVSLPRLLEFSDLVLDGSGSLLLMSDTIPEDVIYFRSCLTSLYVEHGLKVLPLDNMLHSTLQRVKVFKDIPFCVDIYPYDPVKVAREYYYGGVQKISKDMGRIQFSVTGRYVGPVLGLLNRRPRPESE